MFLSVRSLQTVCFCATSPPSGVLKVTGSLLGPLPFLLKTLTVSLYSEKGWRLGTMAWVLFPGKDMDWRSSKILLGFSRLRFLNQWTWQREAMDNGEEQVRADPREEGENTKTQHKSAFPFNEAVIWSQTSHMTCKSEHQEMCVC